MLPVFDDRRMGCLMRFDPALDLSPDRFRM
jgi:hypothetical protein